jgi:ADP-heptose:LPS heptosyltransferase
MGVHITMERLGRVPPRRIAILRALQLGDLLCAVPALRSLRVAWPEAVITLIGLPWSEAFVGRFGRYLDDFLEFPGYPGLPERPPSIERIPAFLAAAQARRFDLAIQMHGSGSFVNPLTVLLGARKNAGFYLPGDFCPDASSFLPYVDAGLEVCRLLRLVEFLGIETRGDELEFPLREEDEQRLRMIPETADLRAGEYICIHPGASVPERRWPTSRFAVVARSLAAHGLRVVLTGTQDEQPLTRMVARELDVPCVDVAGRTDLGSMAALLSGAGLLVSNDTGVSHLAAALRVPSVIISTGNNPERWAPSDHRRHRVLCRDAGVDPREVIAEAKKLLGNRSAIMN